MIYFLDLLMISIQIVNLQSIIHENLYFFSPTLPCTVNLESLNGSLFSGCYHDCLVSLNALSGVIYSGEGGTSLPRLGSNCREAVITLSDCASPGTHGLTEKYKIKSSSSSNSNLFQFLLK